MNRRGILGLIAATPFAGRLAGDVIGAPPSVLGGVGSSSMADQCAKVASEAPGQFINRPVMTEWEAAKVALGDPETLAQMMQAAYERHRVILHVDPDIEVKRSWSPMAKIAFQRQRNVEREIAEMTTRPTHRIWTDIHEKIHKLVWGRS